MVNDNQRIAWKGSIRGLDADDFRAVLRRLDPHSRARLHQLTRSFFADELSTLIWLHEQCLGKQR